MGKNFILDDGQQFILYEGASTQTSFGAPNLNTFIKVDISLLNVRDGTTKTISLVNREVRSMLDAFPLLRSVDNVGAKIGEYLPESSRSTVSIINTPNSFGSERKFSDLFNRYTIVEREIKVWVAELPLGKEAVEQSDFTLEWTAVGTEVSFDSRVCRISMSRSDIPARVMTYNVNLNDFPDAPNSSLGKNLPIIFSSDGTTAEVEAVRVSDMYVSGSDTRIDYVFATTLGVTHTVNKLAYGTSQDNYALIENRSREWQRANFLLWNSFDLNEDGTLYEDDPHSYSYIGTWNPSLKEIGYKFTPGQNIEAGQVLIGIDWYLSTSISGDFYNFQPAKFTLKVYSEWNNYPDELIASSTIDCEVDHATKLELQTNVGSATHIYRLIFELNKAIIVPENSAIFIVLERNDVSENWPNGVFGPVQTNNDSSGTALVSFEQYYLFDSNAYLRNLQTQNQLILDLIADSAEKTAVQTQLDEDASLLASHAEGWKLHVIAGGKDHFHTFGLGILSSTSSPSEYQNGLGFKGFNLIMREQDSPPLEQIRFIISATGLQDDQDGTITGTPLALLDHPLYQVRALMRHWNGTAWVDRQFDHNKFSDTHTEHISGRWSIKTGGATQGRTMLRDILGEICKNSMTRLVPYLSESDYSLGLFCYGTKRDRVAILDDENAQFIGAELRGVETIINQVHMIYNRTIQSRTEELIAEGGFKQYNAFLDSDVTPLEVSLTALDQSKSVWGIRPLNNITFDFLQTDASAQAVGALILRRYNELESIFRVAVPYSRCPDLDCMDIVDVRFVNLPAYYGSSQNPRQALAGTEAVEVDLINGHYWKRLQKYRCAVIGNELVLRSGEPLQRLITLMAINPTMVL